MATCDECQREVPRSELEGISQGTTLVGGDIIAEIDGIGAVRTPSKKVTRYRYLCPECLEAYRTRREKIRREGITELLVIGVALLAIIAVCVWLQVFWQIFG